MNEYSFTEDNALSTLLKMEQSNKNNKSVINEIETVYQELIRKSYNNLNILIYYNQFRIRNTLQLELVRPKVLIGSVNFTNFPNFHTTELLMVADVVSLSAENENRIDRVIWHPLQDTIFNIIERLPTGFSPNIFFDNQIDGNHLIPRMLEQAPFITICSLCHMAKYDVIKSASKLFDLVIPLSKAFIELAKSFNGGKVIDLPFGLNWASFHSMINYEGLEKDIDISITFQPLSQRRTFVYELMKAFENKHKGKFNIYYAESNLPKQDYLNVLYRSKISINVVEIHGPYNYRTCEILNSCTLLFQYHNEVEGVNSYMSDYFIDNNHYVEFNDDNFEHKLLYLLQDQDKINKIALSGLQFLKENYSYSKLYSELFEIVASSGVDGSNRLNKNESSFYLGKFYWSHNTEQFKQGTHLLSDFVSQQNEKDRNTNLLAIYPRMIEYMEHKHILSLFRILDLPSDVMNNKNNFLKYLYVNTNKDIVATWNFLISLGDKCQKRNDLITKITDLLSQNHNLNISEFTLINMQISQVNFPWVESDYHREVQHALLITNVTKNLICDVYKNFMIRFCETTSAKTT